MLPESRILITKFPYYFGYSGVERHTIQLVENLEGKGFKFFLLSSCPVMLSEFQKRGWHNQKWWFCLPPINKVGKWLFPLALPALIVSAVAALISFKRKHHTEKLYCLTLTEKLVMTPIALLLGYKVFWLEHLNVDQITKENFFFSLYLLWSQYVTVVACSESVKKDLVTADVQNVRVIYHGVNMNEFWQQETIFGAMAEHRFVFSKRNTFRLGTVSRLESQRGVEFLIKAVSLIKKEIPEVDLIVVGEGSQRKNLQWLVEQLGLQQEVKLVGWKESRIEWLKDFDVFVLPSVREAFGIVLVEALAAGKPVVASNVGGIPEIIEHEKNGLLVPAGSSEEIANAVIRLKRNRDFALGLGAAGRETVAERFTEERMVEEYRELLRS